MASRDQEESRSSTKWNDVTQKISAPDSFFDIEQLVDKLHTYYNEQTYDDITFFLRRWWCQYYKRPYKDPLLDQYTLEELYFEFLDITYKDRKDAEKDQLNKTNAISAPTDEDYKWAEEMEAAEGNVNIGQATDIDSTNMNPDNIEVGEDIIATF